MRDGEAADRKISEQRLHIAQNLAACRGVARMADGDRARQALDALSWRNVSPTRPRWRSRKRRPSKETMPAASCPRCCKAWRPRAVNPAASGMPKTPKTPQYSRSRSPSRSSIVSRLARWSDVSRSSRAPHAVPPYEPPAALADNPRRIPHLCQSAGAPQDCRSSLRLLAGSAVPRPIPARFRLAPASASAGSPSIGDSSPPAPLFFALIFATSCRCPPAAVRATCRRRPAKRLCARVFDPFRLIRVRHQPGA